ncbi:Ribosomal RNA small subunit methyltransferase A [Candidatus Hepatincola sp. Av]
MNNMFYTKKSLGQHFLINEFVIHKIIAAAGNLTNKTVIEIGPGNLALTQQLVKQAKCVFAIEKDKRLTAKLEDFKAKYSNFNYAIADSLTYEDNLSGTKVLISNLPYNIGTQIFLNYLFKAKQSNFEYFILMFQKEVALRITATVGSKSYGRLSIIAQLLSVTELLFDVDKNNFSPAPKVQSSVIKVTPLITPKFEVDIDKLSYVTNLAFQGKRKTLRNSLKKLNINLADLGIDSNKRAEELFLEEFCKIANSIQSIQNN